MVDHSLPIFILFFGRVTVKDAQLLHAFVVRVLIVLAVVKVRKLGKSEILYYLFILSHRR